MKVTPYLEYVMFLKATVLAGGVLTGKYVSGTASENCRLNLFEGMP